MQLKKPIQPGETPRDRASEQLQAGASLRQPWFHSALAPGAGTPQHTALVSALRREFPEIYDPAGDPKIAG
jgi:hypothetical protein